MNAINDPRDLLGDPVVRADCTQQRRILEQQIKVVDLTV